VLIRGCGRTDFQAGDAGKLYDSVHSQVRPAAGDSGAGLLQSDVLRRARGRRALARGGPSGGSEGGVGERAPPPPQRVAPGASWHIPTARDMQHRIRNIGYAT
jgi:hypothetical protein